MNADILKKNVNETKINDENKCQTNEKNNDHYIQKMTQRKVSRGCVNNVTLPSRPFKKARFAWEIKNYEYTVAKMNEGTVVQPTEEHFGNNHFSWFNNCRNQDYCIPGVDSFNSNFVHLYESQAPQGISLISNRNNEAAVIGSLIPAIHQTNYGSVHTQRPPMLCGTQTPMLYGTQRPPVLCGNLHNDCEDLFPDPDARLIRWQTRQLCRSIFDNTVNRMLENMGFSPLTEHSHGLHPLLVLNLSDDEDKEAEGIPPKALENEVLSSTLPEKELFPPSYHYDPLESGTTSDYDSSEDESEPGDNIVEDDLPCETSQPLQNNAYFNLNFQHPSLAHLISKPLPCTQIDSDIPLPIVNSDIPPVNVNYTSAQDKHDATEDFQNHVQSLTVPSVDNSANDQTVDSPLRYTSRCQDLQCGEEKADDEVDDNENCIKLAEGKMVPGIQPSEINFEDETEPQNTDDKYVIRNAIEMAIKQQEFAFQKA